MSQSQVLLSLFQLLSDVVLTSSEGSDLTSPLVLTFLDGRVELVGPFWSASNRTVFLSCLVLLVPPAAIVDLEADLGMEGTALLLLTLRLRLWWR